MEFLKVEIEIPDVIKDLSAKIEKIEKQSALSGGFLSDLYMGTPYADVDYFVNLSNISEEDFFKKLESLGVVFENLNTSGEYYESVKNIYSVYKGKYKGFIINIIFNAYGENTVKYFDTTMREFYYYKGVSYASKEAIDDIANKKLKVGLCHYPMVSYHRLLKFKERYNFEIDELFLKIVEDAWLSCNYQISDLTNFLNPTKYDDTRAEITNFFTDLMSRRTIDNVDKAFFVSSVSRGHSITRSDFYDVYFHETPKDESYEYSITIEDKISKINNLREDIKKEFSKQLLRLTLVDPALCNEYKTNQDDNTYFDHILMPKINKLSGFYLPFGDDTSADNYSFLSGVNGLISIFNEEKNQLTNFTSKIEIKISYNDIYNSMFVDSSDFIKNNKVAVSVKNAHQNYIVDLEKKQIINSYYNDSFNKSTTFQVVKLALKEKLNVEIS